jgi:hypothetical protein
MFESLRKAGVLRILNWTISTNSRPWIRVLLKLPVAPYVKKNIYMEIININIMITI